MSAPIQHRRNFGALVWHGVFLQVSKAFTQINTIQTALIYTLTGSTLLSGLLLSIYRIGAITPQLFLINRIGQSPKKKQFLIFAVLVRAASLLAVAAVLFGVYQHHPNLSVVMIFAALLLYFLAGGMGDMSYFSVVSKTIQSGERGRLFGLRTFLGGLAGLAAGYMANWIFNEVTPFPEDYILLYISSAAALLIAFIGFYRIQEAREQATFDRKPWYRYFKLLQNDQNFSKFVVTELLLSGVFITLPLFILYAQSQLGMSTTIIGLFVSAQIGGEIVAGPLWGHMGDHLNFRLVLFLIGFVSAATPLLALLLPLVHVHLYIVVFFLVGITVKGLSIGVANYLLQIASTESVPSYVAIKNFMQLPTIVYPVIGGFLVKTIGYAAVFIAASLMLAMGALFSSRLYCVKSSYRQRLSFTQIFE